MTSETREKILQTAMMLFWSHGYEAIGVERICRESGVNKGSFYHFFPSKEDLVLAILDNCWQHAENEFLKPSFVPSAKPMAQFENYLNCIMEQALKMQAETGRSCGCPIGNVANELAPDHEMVRAKIDGIFQNWQGYFKQAFDAAAAQGALNSDLDSETAAAMFLSYLQGSAMMSKTGMDPEQIMENLRLFLRLFIVKET